MGGLLAEDSMWDCEPCTPHSPSPLGLEFAGVIAFFLLVVHQSICSNASSCCLFLSLTKKDSYFKSCIQGAVKDHQLLVGLRATVCAMHLMHCGFATFLSLTSAWTFTARATDATAALLAPIAAKWQFVFPQPIKSPQDHSGSLEVKFVQLPLVVPTQQTPFFFHPGPH